MKTIALCLASASLALAALPAHAAYVIDVQQVGANVVATGSGTIDWTDMTFAGFYSGSAAVNASSGFLAIGFPDYGDYYSGASGPANFGSGGLFTATSGTGADGFEVGVNGSGEIILPGGYGAGDPIPTNTGTWDSETLASLGLTPGVYVWTWGTGPHADSLTIDVGSVPEPAAWALMLTGLAGLGAALRMRRKPAIA